MSTHPRRVLVFGGSFDPPHLAHVRLPELAARELGCDQVLYVPAASNPLKQPGSLAATEHRLAMLQLALASAPWARISTIELHRPGPSYTIDTLKALIREASEPGVDDSARPRFSLLIGADQALDFHRWKDWGQILELARPAVMLRAPWNRASFHQALRERYGDEEAQRWMEWTLGALPRVDISATDIRRRLRAGEPVDDVLHPGVAEYIRINGLYRVS